MRLAFMGTAAFAVPALKALSAAGHETALVVCQPDRPKGRGHALQAPPVKLAAQELGLEVFQPESMKDEAAQARVLSAGAQAICVVAYGQILPKAIVNSPGHGAINVHGSLLPKYRGAAPIEWAIANGERESGVCTQRMAQKLDAGDVLLSRRVPILDEDDGDSMTAKLMPVGAELLVETLKGLEQGTLKAQPQDESQASYAPLLSKADGVADFSQGMRRIYDRFRAFKSRPGAFTAFQGAALKLRRLSQGGPGAAAEAGAIIEISPRGLRVACADGSVWIEELQPASGKAMPAADWARGQAAVKPGARFEAPIL